ncbi:metal dependent phosphohydrolase [Paenibacillus swuensis]|uniref:Metal dependent phosphohydrolase n=1 Tax=Paenibacillus swuensis TaxID=1178515 RepID=A0A172TER5_9BACL|nr:HD domain-containing phosphohydrolase [Paenibacillus swuensis]ANE45426.1 metal dependent phosphohydrolase [Paenibacillus swuensis]
MKCVHIESVEQGDLLGKTIYSSSGTVLLSEGVQLTVFMINTLKRIGVTMVYIKDPNFEDIEFEEMISDETKRAVIKRMAETMEALRSGKDFSTKAVSLTMDQLLDDVMKNRELLVHLTDIRTEDNKMYVHAMNVCMMSVLMGLNRNLNAGQLKELAIGALLHDIGKVGSYNDDGEDMRRHHTWRGFELLKNKREYNLLIAHVAFQHHESEDGTGVPREVGSDQIHLYAKIVAVANTYDNLLHDERVGGKRMLPHEACEHMMALAESRLDRETVIDFLRTVSVYPTGVSVRLSSREMGVVVGQHRGLPSRPIVRVVNGTDDDFEVKEIDLAKHTTIFIESVIA